MTRATPLDDVVVVAVEQAVALDIRDEEGAAILEELLARCDVFVQNLSPAAAKRAGLDSGSVQKRHPSVIACSVSGYGLDGPLADAKATAPARRGTDHATIAPYGAFSTGDGGQVLIAVQNDAEWARFWTCSSSRERDSRSAAADRAGTRCTSRARST